MENLELIDQIDEMLGSAVSGSRKTHVQIQNVMDHFRRQEKGKSQPQNGKAVAQIPNQQPKPQEDK